MNRKNGFEGCEKTNVFSAGISRLFLPVTNKTSTLVNIPAFNP